MLAQDGAALTQMLAWLVDQSNADLASIQIPLHPHSPATAALVRVLWQAVAQTWEAAMIYPVNADNTTVLDYCAAVAGGRRPAGLVVWPTAFDVC